MQNRDLYDLIEAYLNGELPDEQRRQVEQRMATDAAFREEVALHRALQEDYADPARWRLREALTDILADPSPPPEEKQPGLRRLWWAAVPVVLLLVGGIWYFRQPGTPVTSPATETPAPANLVPEKTPALLPDARPQKIDPPKPIALADPVNFAANPAQEALMGVRGDSDISVEITSPYDSTTFQPDDKGKTNLRFSGRLSGAAPHQTTVLNLLIFNNRDTVRVLALPMQVLTDAKGAAAFDLRKTVGLPKGLYYYRIKEGEDWLKVGRFFIGRL